ncbi:hypothetical protein [Microcoleus sp.]|uniref:hypothetical protein n=1 Tax=Microcoleus sp. TaxID=44472 RepID=UPI00403EB7B8
MVSAQLSLFDTEAVIKPTYKIGDQVKLRKKPIAASYVKKGDIVEIVAVHPINGSIKFWNERSERWEFIQRDEIGRVVTNDSVTSVEVAVTESTVPPGDDSVTSVEVAVTESTVPPGDDDYLPFDPISTYRPRGTAPPESGKYYRLSYREGGRVRHQHIRGGNTDSPIAQAKVAEVRSLLAAGESPQSVADFLKNSPR